MRATTIMQDYWRSNLRLIAVLLAFWFLASQMLALHAHAIGAFTLFGFPLGIYLTAHSGLIAYVAIVGYFAWRMIRMDREYDLREE